MRFALLALILSAPFALAAPPEGADPSSPMASWYRSLKTPAGTSCCSIADCRPVRARLAGDHWEIRDSTSDVWQTVPPEVILRRENADGRPVACRMGVKILCFVPPAGA